MTFDPQNHRTLNLVTVKSVIDRLKVYRRALMLGLITPDEYLAEVNSQREVFDLPPLSDFPSMMIR